MLQIVCWLAGYDAAEIIDLSYLDREAFEKDLVAFALLWIAM